jgi:hypothetical protein
MQSLPKPVATIIWECVGADISELVDAYDAHQKDKNLFFEQIDYFDWSYLIDICAAYYAPGYDWIRSTVRLSYDGKHNIDYVGALCCAIRTGNMESAEFALSRSSTVLMSEEKTLDGFLGINLELFSNIPVLHNSLRYIVAAIDSDDEEIFSLVYERYENNLSAQDWCVLAMHLAESGFGIFLRYRPWKSDSMIVLQQLGTGARFYAFELALSAGNIAALDNLHMQNFSLPNTFDMAAALCCNEKITELIEYLWSIDMLPADDILCRADGQQDLEMFVFLWQKKGSCHSCKLVAELQR